MGKRGKHDKNEIYGKLLPALYGLRKDVEEGTIFATRGDWSEMPKASVKEPFAEATEPLDEAP